MPRMTDEQKLRGTYWYNNDGKYQGWFDSNFSKLVPESGKADTTEGEMLRAASRIYYDLFNNGGCNNTSGAVRFLQDYEDEFATYPRVELSALWAECNTGEYNYSNLFDEAEVVLNAVIESIIAKNGNFTPNEIDLFDYQENGYVIPYAEEDEYEYYGE